MTIGEGESNRYIVINPRSRKFESYNPGALFVVLSRAKTAGGDAEKPDFAWHSSVLVNHDRLCHVVETPTTKTRLSEIDRIQKLSVATQTNFSHLKNDLDVPSEDIDKHSVYYEE